VYLLKEKTQILIIIKDFINELKTSFLLLMFCAQIMFLNILKRSFWAFYDILHQTICSHTSQQNVVAERKLRHLREVNHTLLIHMLYPKYFGLKLFFVLVI